MTARMEEVDNRGRGRASRRILMMRTLMEEEVNGNEEDGGKGQ